MKFYKLLIVLQSSYLLITAVWPIAHIESFMDVTGPKTDIWLVKTVGALLIPVAAALFFQPNRPNRTSFLLGGGTAISFIVINFYYALNDIIADIYLIDGVVQILFFLCWTISGILYRQKVM